MGEFIPIEVVRNPQVDQLVEQLKVDEGFSSTPYKDTEGNWTVGYGHLLGKGDEFADASPMSEEQALEQLRLDVESTLSDSKINELMSKVDDPRRKNVIANMGFNLGPTKLRGFEKMIKALGEGDYERASAEMLDSKWAGQVKGRAIRLANEMREGSKGGEFEPLEPSGFTPVDEVEPRRPVSLDNLGLSERDWSLFDEAKRREAFMQLDPETRRQGLELKKEILKSKIDQEFNLLSDEEKKAAKKRVDSGDTPGGVFDLPSQEAFFIKSKKQRVGEFAKGVASGALGVGESLSGGLEWIGLDSAKKVGDWIEEQRRELTPSRPDFYTDLASGVGSMGMFMIPGLGASSLATRLGIRGLAGWVGASSMATMEAFTEAGGVWRESMKERGDEGEANKASWFSFTSNLPLLLVTNRLGLFAARSGIVKKAFQSAVFEGPLQESPQSVIEDLALKHPVSIEKALRSGAVGFVLGGAAGPIVDLVVRDAERLSEVPDDVTRIYNREVKKARQEGLNWEDAHIRGTQKLADSPEGVQYLKEVSETLDKVLRVESALGVANEELGKIREEGLRVSEIPIPRPSVKTPLGELDALLQAFPDSVYAKVHGKTRPSQEVAAKSVRDFVRDTVYNNIYTGEAWATRALKKRSREQLELAKAELVEAEKAMGKIRVVGGMHANQVLDEFTSTFDRAMRKVDEAETLVRDDLLGEGGFVKFPRKLKEDVSLVAHRLGQAATRMYNETIKKAQFYPDAPPQLQNAVRTNLIGQIHRLGDVKVAARRIIFGDMNRADTELVAELVFAKNDLARKAAGVGNPDLSLDETRQAVIEAESRIGDREELREAAKRWNDLVDATFNRLVEAGLVDPENHLNDYAHIYTAEHTPTWAFKHGVPRRLREQIKGYTKKARGSAKPYIRTPEVLLDHLVNVEHDLLIDDFIRDQATHYDITPELSREQKVELFGLTKKGRVRGSAPKSGRVYEINGQRYRSWSPKRPFERSLYKTEDLNGREILAVGGPTKIYLLPENVYNTFENLSAPGSKTLRLINQITSVWKGLAITSHFISFNRNNLVGDAIILAYQHPNKTSLIRHIEPGMKFLFTKEASRTQDQTEFAKWLSEHDIIGASFIHEMPAISKSKNPALLIARGAWKVSELRESILRTINAHYLWTELKKGKAMQARKDFDSIDTRELDDESAIGKISREILIDYGRFNKVYNSLIRGFISPFAPFYHIGTKLVWKQAVKHPWRSLAALNTIPAIVFALNNRDDETRKLWDALPDGVKEGTTIVLGRNEDGTIKTLNFQTPFDVLIGTKVFGIAWTQANMVLNGSKSVEDAARDTLRHWGEKEASGAINLLNPMIRYIKGLMDDRDPYDNTPIYPFVDKSKMNWWDRKWYEMVFFLKTAVPFLGAYVNDNVRKVKTPKKALYDTLERSFGPPAFGIYGFEEKVELTPSGYKKIDYEMLGDVPTKVEQDEAKILNEVQEQWIKSGMEPAEFVKTERFEVLRDELFDLHRGAGLGVEEWKSLVDRLRKAAAAKITEDPQAFRLWIDNKIDDAESDVEKRRLREVKKRVSTYQLYKSFKRLPKSVRPHALVPLEGARGDEEIKLEHGTFIPAQ